MGTSSTLVNVAEDAEHRLIQLLIENAAGDDLVRGSGRPSGQFRQECQECISSGDATKLVRAVLREGTVMNAFLVVEPDEEAAGAFSLLAALLERSDRQQSKQQQQQQQQRPQSGLGFQAAEAVSKSGGGDASGDAPAASLALAERKVALLSVLYNMRPSVSERCDALRRMFRLSRGYPDDFLDASSVDQPLARLLRPDSGDGDDGGSSLSSAANAAAAAATRSKTARMIAIPETPRLVSILDAWGVSPPDRRDLYWSVVDALPPEGDVRRQRFLLLLVDTYDGSSQIDDDGVRAARMAAVGAVRDPVSLHQLQRSMMHRPAVRALLSSSSKGGSTKKSDSALYGLLQIFQEGKLSDYNHHVQSNGGEDKFLKPLGLDPESCRRHMKILSLCTLASENDEIPYGAVANALGLGDDGDGDENNGGGGDEVERWVIAAVNSGMLEAKMDQMRRLVMVERCVVRKFDLEQWKSLQSRLREWKDNVGGILHSLRQSRAAAAAVTAAAGPNPASP